MVGITLTRALPPTQPPPSNIIGKSKDNGGISLPSSMPKNGMTYAQTLRQTFVKKTKGEDKIPEFEPPNLNNSLTRKLQLLPTEFQKESSYCSDEVAAYYRYLQPTQGPFIIVPSLSKEDVTAEFSLTSK